MTHPRLNYDKISGDYNQRYPSAFHWDRGDALLELARQLDAKSILETGSGTGYWLNLLNRVTSQLYGLDFSAGMISQAKSQPAPLKLTRGTATRLPFRSGSFDLLYCVDAVHHFGDHAAFVEEAFRVLKPGGALAVIGHDPHGDDFDWYFYDYFDTVYETDLRRYPSSNALEEMMKRSGFHDIERRNVEHVMSVHEGGQVFNDPFLKQNATSQLALLSRETYDAGIEKIKADLKKDSRKVFKSDFWVRMVLGMKPEHV
ncbi:MAG: methyltransferase domain-containing protein [Chloroflexi bacterium]|nr:methyltransferase domain-containing protein [Chloroflexota bacterium]